MKFVFFAYEFANFEGQNQPALASVYIHIYISNFTIMHDLLHSIYTVLNAISKFIRNIDENQPNDQNQSSPKFEN